MLLNLSTVQNYSFKARIGEGWSDIALLFFFYLENVLQNSLKNLVSDTFYEPVTENHLHN